METLRNRQVKNFLALQPAGDRHADAAHGRRGAAHAARQQQRVLSGQRHQLVRLGPARASRRTSIDSSTLLTAFRQQRDVVVEGSTQTLNELLHRADDRVARRRAQRPRLERRTRGRWRSRSRRLRTAFPAARHVQRVLGAVDVRVATSALGRRLNSGAAASIPRSRHPTTSTDGKRRRCSGHQPTWCNRDRSSTRPGASDADVKLTGVGSRRSAQGLVARWRTQRRAREIERIHGHSSRARGRRP